jgi:heme exporter protein CcmD
VWGSYLVALITLGGEVLLLLRRKRALPNDKADG